MRLLLGWAMACDSYYGEELRMRLIQRLVENFQEAEPKIRGTVTYQYLGETAPQQLLAMEYHIQPRHTHYSFKQRYSGLDCSAYGLFTLRNESMQQSLNH